MPLKIALKPKEKLFIGGAVLMNGESSTEFMVLNSVTILREKDILTEETATSPCRCIYLTIQLMYMDERENLSEHHKNYWSLVKDVVEAAPSFESLISDISELILVDNYYKALKLAKKLINKETEVIGYAEISRECV
ncbi:MAG: flagellar biosynthesis repressor FlbT [Gammaproteobacteria bacterium]